MSKSSEQAQRVLAAQALRAAVKNVLYVVEHGTGTIEQHERACYVAAELLTCATEQCEQLSMHAEQLSERYWEAEEALQVLR